MHDLRPLRYPLHQQRLDNGLRVIVSPDHAAPVVAMNLWYLVGSKDERLEATGFAHLFEHLMFQGSAHVASGEHLAALQAAGGSANATTWFDRTNYFASVPTGALNLALWLEADRMATLGDHLTQENLDTQREVVKEEKRQRYDNVPYGNMIEHLTKLAYPEGHPYAHSTIGSMDDLDRASLADAKEFFATYYVPNNAILTLVGDIEPADAFDRINTYFGHIPAGAAPPRAEAAALSSHQGLPEIDIVTPVPADAMYYTWRLPARTTDDFMALHLGLDILGGGLTSRLYRRLVQSEAITAGAGASALGMVLGTSMGFGFARALPAHSLEKIEKVFLDEWERFLAEGPTPTELKRSLRQYQRAWLSELGEFSSRADAINTFAALHDDPTVINTRLMDMAALTTTQVHRACQRYLRPEHRAVLRYRRGPFSGDQS